MCFKVECEFCDNFEEKHDLREEAKDSKKEHLITHHETEVRQNYSAKGKKCQHGCGYKISSDLICEGPEKHDNLNWYAGELAGYTVSKENEKC